MPLSSPKSPVQSPFRPPVSVPPAVTESLPAIALLLAVALGGLMSLFPLANLDIWWHLKTGQVVLEQRSVPTQDLFTYTAAGRSWISHEWLADVLFYGLYQLGGANLLVLFKVLLSMAILGVAAAAALVGPQARARLAAVAMGVLLAVPLLSLRAFVRPHLISALLLAVTLLALRREAVNARRRWLFGLIPLYLIWANLHSGFVLGLALMVLYWLGEALGRRLGCARPDLPPQWRFRLLTLAVLLLVSLFNPHHVEAFLYPFRLLARAEVRDAIVELRNVFHPAYEGALFRTALLAVAVVLFAALIGPRRRLDLALLLPALVFGAVALNSVRGVTELAVLVPALVGVHAQRVVPRRPLALATAVVVILLSLGGGAMVLQRGVPLGSGSMRKVGLGVDRGTIPEAAARFLGEVAPAGRAFNVLGYGGYLIYELWPQRQIYVDGRLDIFPEGFLAAYGRLMSTGQDWEETCRLHDITLAVVNYRPAGARPGGLRDLLREDPDWVCVYFSVNALIYARRVPENADLLARFGTPLDPSHSSIPDIRRFAATAAAPQLDRIVAAMQAMLAVTPGEQTILVVLGQVLDAAGRSEEGAGYLRQAVASDPESTSARLLLADVLGRTQDIAAARAEVATVLALEPENSTAWLVLADIEWRAGDLDAARRALESAVQLDPRNGLAHDRLGDLFAQQGQLSEAEYHYRRALQRRPGDPALQRKLAAVRESATEADDR